MFFYTDHEEKAHISATELQNPIVPGHAMTLILFGKKVTTILYSVWANKPVGEFYDAVTRLRISRKNWTPEMRIFYKTEIRKAEKVKGGFKLRFMGYIFILLVCAFFATMIFGKLSAAGKENVVADNLNERVRAGDLYFGRFQEMTPRGSMVRDGYAWFKVTEVRGDTVYIVLGKETTGNSKGSGEVSDTGFADSIYHTTIREQKDYTIDFRTPNSEMMFNASRKKKKLIPGSAPFPAAFFPG